MILKKLVYGIVKTHCFIFPCTSHLVPVTLIALGFRAAIAQLGERQTEDLKVPGSIPGLGICSCCKVLAPSSCEVKARGSRRRQGGGLEIHWALPKGVRIPSLWSSGQRRACPCLPGCVARCPAPPLPPLFPDLVDRVGESWGVLGAAAAAPLPLPFPKLRSCCSAEAATSSNFAI